MTPLLDYISTSPHVQGILVAVLGVVACIWSVFINYRKNERQADRLRMTNSSRAVKRYGED